MTRGLTILLQLRKGKMYKIALNIVINWTLMNTVYQKHGQ